MSIFSWLKGKLSGGSPRGSDQGARFISVGAGASPFSASIKDNAVYQASVNRAVKILSKIDWSIKFKDRDATDRADLNYLLNVRPNPMQDAVNFRQQFFKSYYENNLAVAWIQRDYRAIGSPTKAIWPVDPSSEFFQVGLDQKNSTMAFSFQFGQERIRCGLEDIIVMAFVPSADNPFLSEDANRAIKKILAFDEQNFQGLAASIANAQSIQFIAQSPQILDKKTIKERQKDLGESYASAGEIGIWYVDGRSGQLKQVQSPAQWNSSDEVQKQEAHIYEYLGIPQKIVDGTATDDEYQSYVEMSVEPIAMQLGLQLTDRLITRNEFARGRRIELETNDLFTASQAHRSASATTLISSGRYHPNEIRRILGAELLPESEDGLIDRIDRIDTEKEQGQEPEGGEDGNQED